jgi:hypothetical protein
MAAVSATKCTRCADTEKKLVSAKRTNFKFADRIVLLEDEAIQDRSFFAKIVNKNMADMAVLIHSHKTQLDATSALMAAQSDSHKAQLDATSALMAAQNDSHKAQLDAMNAQMAAQNMDIKRLTRMFGAIVLRKLVYVSRAFIWTECYGREEKDYTNADYLSLTQDTLTVEFFDNYVVPLQRVNWIVNSGSAVDHVMDQSELEFCAFEITRLPLDSQRDALKFWFLKIYGKDPETVVFERMHSL